MTPLSFPPVVEGEVFPTSKRKGAGWLLVGIFLISMSLLSVLYWDRLFFGLLLFIGGVVYVLGFAAPLLLGNRRLILGNEFLQVVRGKDHVLLQIPYTNIHCIHCGDFFGSDTLRLGIVLKNRNDVSTFSFEAFGTAALINRYLRDRSEKGEFDVIIDNEYSEDVGILIVKIKQAGVDAVGTEPPLRCAICIDEIRIQSSSK